MAHSLVEQLTKLPATQWSARSPADPAALERLEKTFDLILPEDYRSLMLHSDGGALDRFRTNLNLSSVSDLSSLNYDEWYRKQLPGMFIIGDDGGGSLFFYDEKGQLNHGAYALFLVPMNELGLGAAIFAGHTLTDAVRDIVANEDFFKRPQLRKA
jgi:hypothetical protein